MGVDQAGQDDAIAYIDEGGLLISLAGRLASSLR